MKRDFEHAKREKSTKTLLSPKLFPPSKDLEVTGHVTPAQPPLGHTSAILCFFDMTLLRTYLGVADGSQIKNNVHLIKILQSTLHVYCLTHSWSFLGGEERRGGEGMFWNFLQRASARRSQPLSSKKFKLKVKQYLFKGAVSQNLSKFKQWELPPNCVKY